MKTRIKKSYIWKIPKLELEEIIKHSNTIGDILSKLGFKNHGGNPRTLKSRIIYENIDISHLKIGEKYHKRKCGYKKQNLDTILILNSTFSRTHLKTRLIKEGIIENKCNICGLGPEWNNQKLSLQLDHINGINNDNRIENLRLLCPNCHSQTDNFAGRSCKK